jgi:hypothetical protein
MHESEARENAAALSVDVPDAFWRTIEQITT